MVRIPNVQEIQTNNEGRNSGQKPKVLLERSNVVSSSESRNHMRDVYNRRKKLSDWIEKVNQDLDRSDRTDVLKFVEYMKYNANAILWIVRSLKYECEESPLISRGGRVGAIWETYDKGT